MLTINSEPPARYRLDDQDTLHSSALPSCTYRAACLDHQGLPLGETVVMIQIHYNGHTSPWVALSGDMGILKRYPSFKDSVLDRVDREWIPSLEWTLKSEAVSE